MDTYIELHIYINHNMVASKTLAFLCLVSIIKVSSAKWDQYYGYKVYDVEPQTDKQVKLLHELSERPNYLQLSDVNRVGKEMQIGIPPSDVEQVEMYFADEHIVFEIYTDDMKTYLVQEEERLDERYSNGRFAFDIEDFNTLEDINAELLNMANRCPNDLGIFCEVGSIGQSYEGRDINMLKIYKESDGSPRPAYWVDSGIHCGEWLPPATNLKILDRMTRNYSIDSIVTDLLDKYDWHFMIIMNPDGYEYTWNEDRFWRKSRQPNENSTCMGTDLNRNFDHMWMNSASGDPCSNNYAGASPASEIETQVVQNQINALAPSLVGLVTLHSAAEMWLHPWGFVDDNGDCVYAEDDEWMLSITDPTVEAVMNTFGDLEWTGGNTCETIYPASGTTMDWAKGVAGINYTCTPELRSPYDPTPEHIDISYQEIWNGLVTMVYALETNQK